VTASSVTVVHDDGIGKIDLAQLPAALQKKYAYDPLKAQRDAATEKIANDRLAVEASIAREQLLTAERASNAASERDVARLMNRRPTATLTGSIAKPAKPAAMPT
jgi:hypothetical protein